jgi:hypothetical protein
MIKKYKPFLTQKSPNDLYFIHCVNQVLSILGDPAKYNEFTYPENLCNLPNKLIHPMIKNIGECPRKTYNDDVYIGHITSIYDNSTN